MRHPIPPFHEAVAACKDCLPHTPGGPKKPRRQRRSRPASRQAHTRQDVARLREVHRHPLRRCLAVSATSGLATLWATSSPGGQPVSLAPAGLARRPQALPRADGAFNAGECLPAEREGLLEPLLGSSRDGQIVEADGFVPGVEPSTLSNRLLGRLRR